MDAHLVGFSGPWQLLMIAVAVIIFSCRDDGYARDAAKPNVLILVADDLGFADVGFNGGTIIATPNLDQLAATGIRLNDFRACPMCSPTRAGLLTGRWPLRFGMMRAVVPPWSRYGLPAEELTLPEILAGAGYQQRAVVGKWHLGHAQRQFLPLAHSVTRFYGHYNGALDYFTHQREGEVDWHDNDRTVHQEGYTTDLLAAEAARLVREAPSGQPWFLYVPFNAPHSPLQAKPEDLEKYQHLKPEKHRAYAAMVDCLDQAIGQILSAVQSRPDAENTFVLFFSDNGGIPRVGSSNGPWRAGKLTVYEGGTRVCAAVRWPAGGLEGGRCFNQRIGYIDVLPTLAAAAGVSSPSNIDGINVLPALQGKAKLPDRLWFSYIHQDANAHASVHQARWKLVAHGDFFAAQPSNPPDLELYDLGVDPSESNDLSAQRPRITAALHAQLREFGSWQRAGIGPYAEGRAGFKAPKDWIVNQ